MRVAFYTLGCKLNQTETESIASSFRESSYEVVDAAEEASLYIINTCTVTTMGEQKARRMVRKILRERPDAAVIVTGCYVQLEQDEAASLGDRVVTVPLDRKDLLLDLPRLLDPGVGTGAPERSQAGTLFAESVRAALQGPAAETRTDSESRFRFLPSSSRTRIRPALKIQDGCNNRCAYCRVPLARGRSVSLEADEAVRRVTTLEARGHREIVLTGVNLTSYRSGAVGLAELLDLLLERTSRIRFRLSSLEPDEIDLRLARIVSHERICPHFHLPIQSGSDSVLRSMRRKYDTSRVRDAVSLLRDAKPDPYLAADLIVGFPGETDAEFDATYRLISELDLSYLHIFPFSPRPGTAAFTMQPRVPEFRARARADSLKLLSDSRNLAYRTRQIGRRLQAVLERRVERSGGPFMQGTTENYLKVLIPVREIPSPVRGELVACRPERLDGSGFYAVVPADTSDSGLRER